MDKKRLSLKTNPKVTIRKDLFGAHDSETDQNVNSVAEENSQSPLKSIWGESDSFTNTQPTSNSLLLSPALKRSPNRFSTSPSPKKKVSSPRKLSKYSPFRKKVYNPNPRNSIKNWFNVKERSPSEIDNTSLGITKLCDAGASTSGSNITITSNNSKIDQDKKILCGDTFPQGDTRPDLTPKKNTGLTLENQNSTPNTTPKNTPQSTPAKSNRSTPQSAKKNSPSRTKDVYSALLSRVILEVMLNASNPDNVKLLSDEEFAHINAFTKFDQPSQRLYGQLLNRKLDWIRTATMKYGDVTLQLMLLQQNGFIKTDCSKESLETLLNILTIPDLKKLCKSYKLPESGHKCDLISKLISRTKQPSIKNFFGKATGENCAENNLRKKLYELLGVVVKVESGPHRTFSRCLLFFSYPHFHGLERDRFSDQLSLVGQLRNLTFPEFQLTRTTVFKSREQFLTYEAALLESSSLIEAKEDKNLELALIKLRGIVSKLRSYLSDETIRAEVEAMPDFLRRWTAGNCYVRAVSSSVEVFKRTASLAEGESCLELLLSQRVYGHHRRGQWFEQLALLYQNNFKDNIKACETVLRGLRDAYIDVVSRHTLCARAAMLEGRKKNGLKDFLKDALATQRGLVEKLDEPLSITITEQIFNSCRQGSKQVYIQDSEDGKMLSSVEEVAREHFRRQGYIYGWHDEGGIIKSLIYACFWDEIYGITEVDGHGLFHSEFQTTPLDWNSEAFYDRRREKLRSKLQDLAEGGVDAVVNTFLQCYTNNLSKESIVNWKYLEQYEVVESLIRSIDIDVFLNLSRLLLKHNRVYGAGFPDLTLWDPQEKKCVFVEVKSPNDQLSMKQKVWLHSLNKMGAKALVCHVQSVGCKAQKRKASPETDS